MSIRVQCPNPSCGASHKVKSRYAGKRCLCPSCGKPFQVPASAPDSAAPLPPVPAPAVPAPALPPAPVAQAPTPPPPVAPVPASVPLAIPAAAPVQGQGAGRIPVAAPVTAPVQGPVPLAAPVAPPVQAAAEEPAPRKMPVLELPSKKPEPASPKQESDKDLDAFLDAVREEEAASADRAEEEPVLEASEDEEVVLIGRRERDNGQVAHEAQEDDLAAFLNAVEEEEKQPAVADRVAEESAIEDAIVMDEIEDATFGSAIASPDSEDEVEEAELVDDDAPILAEMVEDEPLAAEVVEEEPLAAEVVEDDEPIDAELVEEDEADEKPRSRKKRTITPEEEEEADVDEETRDKAPPARHYFSWTAVVFLLLGTLAVYSLVAVPFVGGTSKVKATGDLGKFPPREVTHGFGDLDTTNLKTALWGIPAAMGTLALLGLLIAVFSRSFDALSKILVYLAAVLTAAYLLLAGMKLEAQLRYFEERKTYYSNHIPTAGDLSLQLAPYLWLGVFGAAAALLLLGVGLLLMHRQLWARLVFLLVFLAVVGAGVYTALYVKIDTIST